MVVPAKPVLDFDGLAGHLSSPSCRYWLSRVAGVQSNEM